jgi:prepilin-type N-terminal cleavage/methylation domain-containing protein
LLRRIAKQQKGYSLVEVLAAILILSLAIIPMVSMFDAGLRAARTSGDYDTARALANQKLEQAKSAPYEVVRDAFPVGTSPAPSGFSYAVTKQFVSKELKDTGSDEGLMKVTVTVNWGSGNSYSTTGVVSR